MEKAKFAVDTPFIKNRFRSLTRKCFIERKKGHAPKLKREKEFPHFREKGQPMRKKKDWGGRESTSSFLVASDKVVPDIPKRGLHRKKTT